MLKDLRYRSCIPIFWCCCWWVFSSHSWKLWFSRLYSIIVEIWRSITFLKEAFARFSNDLYHRFHFLLAISSRRLCFHSEEAL
jgi:hypothetical protein